MNGHGKKPPDKPKSNDILDQNESIFGGMEIKEEPTVKQEPEEDDIVTVSRPTYTANGMTLDNLYKDQQVDGIEGFSVFRDLSHTKLGVKIEKVKEDEKQGPKKSFDKIRTPANGVMNRFSKNKEHMSNGLNSSLKKMVIEARKRKANRFGDKKTSSVEKANEKRHKCSSCNYTTDIRTNLNTHILNHTGEKPHPCTICPKRFTRKRSLQLHMKTHVDDFLFSCSNCFQGFQHNEEKLGHEANCTIRRYDCYLCKEYSTLHKPHLVEHMRVHTGDKPFQCDHCSMIFNHASSLKKHRKTHINPRPLKFKCSICFKSFKQQKEKEQHEANCKRPGYKCDLCKSYTTNDKGHLVRHMRIHTGEKPFQCEICSKYFARNTDLTRHKKIHK